jgi:hypothetical protein
VDERPAERKPDEAYEDECDEELPRHALHRTDVGPGFFPVSIAPWKFDV